MVPVSQAEKVNILMVDDQPAKLLSYETILAELGENLIKASSGREALEILLKQDIGVVLMDVSMPQMDGFETAELIRQHPRFQKTAIIFISGVHLTDLDRLKGYQRGAVDYISVPVVPELLRAKVSIFAELHRKTRELEALNRDLEGRVLDRTEELRKNSDILRERADLLDLATEAIMVRDLDGVLHFWNSGAENLYGWDRTEVIGKKVNELLQTVHPVPAADIEETIIHYGKWNGNLVQYTRDGQRLIVESRQVFKVHAGGKRGTVLEINRDITSHLQAEEALRKSERLAAMGRVAGIIAHEINNPLEAITNAVFLLGKKKCLDEGAKHFVQLASEELSRVAQITRQTLSYYRETAQPVPLSVAKILDDVLELQSRSLRLNGITLEKKYESVGSLVGIPAELKQVFLNLIGNAIQAMPEGGRLRVRVAEQTSRTQKGVRVAVSDTGVGISSQDSKHLFQPFFTTKAAKGTGLGLWISKGIIQKYEGSIQFRSIRSNGTRATCFSVFLPSDKKSAQPDRLVKQEAIGSH
jgi:PAS domain S-box-containing protein